MFTVKITKSKYLTRIGQYYEGVLGKSGTPLYIYGKIRVPFKDIYEFAQIINTDDKKSAYEEGEIISIPFNEFKKIKFVDTIKNKKIKLKNGKSILLENAVKLGDYYYEKDVDVIFYKGNWVKKLPHFIKCSITGEYEIITNLNYGVVDYVNEKIIIGPYKKEVLKQLPFDLPLFYKGKIDKFSITKNNAILGYNIYNEAIYDQDLLLNIPKFNEVLNKITTTDNKLKIKSKEILDKLNFAEDLRVGVFVKDLKDTEHIPTPKYRKFNQKKTQLKSNSYALTDGYKYTFGVELETTSGILPEHAAHGLNAECMRDGSISSGEYVTGVLSGDDGIQQLNKLMYEVNRRCTFDNTCGLHIHIGSADFTKKFTVAAFCLSQIIKKELFSIVNPSRRNNRYCTDIPNTLNKVTYKNILDDDFVQECYLNIFEFLKDGESMETSPITDKYPKYQSHKMRRGWGRAPRYTWLNLLPCNFVRLDRENISNDQIYGKSLAHTLEFRLHQGTLDFMSTYNWLLLCISYVSYCEQYADSIIEAYFKKDKIYLKDIFNAIYSAKFRNKLIEYIENKKSFYTSSSNIKINEELITNTKFKENEYNTIL